MFQMTNHSEQRAAQRCLTTEEVEYVMQFGKRYFSEGARVYYLRRKDLPGADHRLDCWNRLVGTAVVVSCDRQSVITVWRNRKTGLKFLRRRSAGSRRKRPGSASEGFLLY